MNTLHIPCKTGEISDGYHTFDELYEHRCTLFLAFMQAYPGFTWASKRHDDGTSFEGWFVAGIELPCGMVTYHLPLTMWHMTTSVGCSILRRAPKYDGHKSNDVINRLQCYITRSLDIEQPRRQRRKARR